MFGKDEEKKGTEAALGDAKKSPPRVETIQGTVKALTAEAPGKVKATVVLNGEAGEIRIAGKRFVVGESVMVSITAEN